MKKSKTGKSKSKTSFFKTSLFSYLLFLILLSLGAFLLGIFVNSDGSGLGEFAHYRGPVLPMTSLNDAEGVETTRNVNFDFSPYQYARAYSLNAMGAAGITDTYVLTNTTGETKTLELAYAFQGSFNDQSEEFPTITVDGIAIQPELFPSIDPEEKLYYSGSFKKYSQLIEENDYLSMATNQYGEPNIPVTAYHFTDLAYNGTVSALNPMFTLRCVVDENTTFWSMGLTKIDTEKDGRKLMMISVNKEEAWLFTVGGLLTDPEFGGNDGFYIEKDSAIDGVTFQLETYETTLMDALGKCAEKYLETDGESNVDCITPELLTKYAVRRIQALGYLNIRFDSLFYDEIHESRMMYLVFPVELEPGETITVEAAYIQEPSWDGSGPKHYREGYDLATKLGSDLNFTTLSSSLSNTDFIQLGEQNFGFDLENGITNVMLDLQIERYYLEVYIKR